MSTHTIPFNKRAIDEIAPPSSGRLTLHDSKVPGLVVRVTPNGVKTFQVYRWRVDRPVRVTLGRFPDMTVEQARRQAQTVITQLLEGVNPNAVKRRERATVVTLRVVFDDYLSSRDLKPRTVEDYNALMDWGFSGWLSRPITAITRDSVLRRHAQLGERSHARANSAMRVLRALFNFAIHRYDDDKGTPLVELNPVDRLSSNRQWFRVERRQTLIRVHQLPGWWSAVEALKSLRSTGKVDVVRDYLQFLLLTGLRRGEAARLRWDDVDLPGRAFTVVDTKNRRPHELPTSDYLQALLERRHQQHEQERERLEREHREGKSPELRKPSSYVFPGEGKTAHIVEPRRWMERVTAESGVAFTLHDLRRTFATVAESLDIPAYALKRLLNHKTGSDVTAGYIVIDVERLRGPMQQVTDFILKAAGVKPTAPVVKLQGLDGGDHRPGG